MNTPKKDAWQLTLENNPQLAARIAYFQQQVINGFSNMDTAILQLKFPQLNREELQILIADADKNIAICSPNEFGKYPFGKVLLLEFMTAKAKYEMHLNSLPKDSNSYHPMYNGMGSPINYTPEQDARERNQSLL